MDELLKMKECHALLLEYEEFIDLIFICFNG